MCLHLANVTYISFQTFPDMSSGKLDFWKPGLLTMEASLWATPYRKLEICALGFWFYRTWVSTAMDQGLHQQVFDTQSVPELHFPQCSFVLFLPLSCWYFFTAMKFGGYYYFPHTRLFPKYASVVEEHLNRKVQFWHHYLKTVFSRTNIFYILFHKSKW